MADEPRGNLPVRRPRPASGPVEDYSPRPRRDEADEFPSEQDIERFSDVTVDCPECGTRMYDDAEVCWKCGHAVMGARRARLPMWVVVAGLVVIAAMLLAIF
jgi:uncharacterized protein (DUF983 family)